MTEQNITPEPADNISQPETPEINEQPEMVEATPEQANTDNNNDEIIIDEQDTADEIEYSDESDLSDEIMVSVETDETDDILASDETEESDPSNPSNPSEDTTNTKPVYDTPKLNQRQLHLMERVEQRILIGGAEPPHVSIMSNSVGAPPDAIRAMAALLVKRGKIYIMADDLYIHALSFEEVESQIRGYIQKNGQLMAKIRIQY